MIVTKGISYYKNDFLSISFETHGNDYFSSFSLPNLQISYNHESEKFEHILNVYQTKFTDQESFEEFMKLLQEYHQIINFFYKYSHKVKQFSKDQLTRFFPPKRQVVLPTSKEQFQMVLGTILKEYTEDPGYYRTGKDIGRVFTKKHKTEFMGGSRRSKRRSEGRRRRDSRDGRR